MTSVRRPHAQALSTNKLRALAAGTLLLLTLVATGWGGIRLLQSHRDDREQIARLRSLYFLQGKILPALALTSLTGRSVVVSGDSLPGLSVVWIVSKQDCLACLGESSYFHGLIQRFPDTRMVMIGIGGDRHFFQAVHSSEQLPFPVWIGSAADVLGALELPERTPYKLLALDGVILSAERGTLPTDVTFHERAELVARHLQDATGR